MKNKKLLRVAGSIILASSIADGIRQGNRMMDSYQESVRMTQQYELETDEQKSAVILGQIEQRNMDYATTSLYYLGNFLSGFAGLGLFLVRDDKKDKTEA